MWSVIVRYGEIALKSKPVRSAFERQLVINIEKMLASVPHELRRIRGRIFIDTVRPEKAVKILSEVPGVFSCSPAVKTSAGLDQIVFASVGLAKKSILPGQKFAIRTKRRGNHAFTSREVNERVGAEVLRSIKGSKVDLSHPDVELFVEIWGTEAYVFSKNFCGPGGFPVGTQGKVLSWFFGGQRDLRAARQMLKKGCEVELLVPKNDRVIARAKNLLKHHHTVKIHVVNTALLRHPGSKKFSNLIFRRSLVRLGNLLARRTGAKALVFSDGINLLISRGLEWIRLVDEASELPVFRPLLGEELRKLKPGRVSGKRLPSLQGMKTEESLVTDDFIFQLQNQVETMSLKVTS